MEKEEKKTPEEIEIEEHEKKGYKIISDFSSYFREEDIDTLGAAEGHWKGITGPKSEKEKKKKIFTTFYGVQKDGLSSIKELYAKKVYVPSKLRKHTVDTLTEEDAREIAKYIAVHNTMIMDKNSKSGDAFSKLPIEVKGNLLTLLHTGGVHDYKDSYNDDKAKFSLMKAIDSKDVDAIARAIITAPDGKKIENPHWSDEKKVGKKEWNERDGRLNRYFVTVKRLYDTSFVLTPENKDGYYSKWRREKTSDKVFSCLDAIDKAKGEIFEETQKLCYQTTVFENLPLKKKEEPKKETEPVNQNVEPKPQEKEMSLLDSLKSFFNNFTNGDKKMQTEQSGGVNGTGNENNNLQ